MLAVPVVLMIDDPPRTEAPLIVPLVNKEPSIVLLVRVWLASAVTMSPDVGYTAVEEVPVPPALDGSMPLVAAASAKLSAPKEGRPPPAGTLRI
jgi:hypothetical protein